VFPWLTTAPRRAFSGETLQRLDWPHRAAELQLHVERSPGLDVEHSAADRGATAFPMSTTGHAERPSFSSTSSDPQASTLSTPPRTRERLRSPWSTTGPRRAAELQRHAE
jgi:hypothetical protein